MARRIEMAEELGRAEFLIGRLVAGAVDEYVLLRGNEWLARAEERHARVERELAGRLDEHVRGER